MVPNIAHLCLGEWKPMVLAMPMREGKISAYLELAESLLVVRIEGGQEYSRESIPIEGDSLMKGGSRGRPIDDSTRDLGIYKSPG